MRKYTSILLLNIFLFNIGGYYLLFSILQFSIQQEIEQEISKNLKDQDLILITASANNEADIAWIKLPVQR
jgi:hypothetical protein